MRRKTAFSLVVLLVILGLVGGYFLEAWLTPPTSSPVSAADVGNAAPAARPQSTGGWCCQKAGTTCVTAAAPVDCLGDTGIAFNRDEQTCDYYCTHVQP